MSKIASLEDVQRRYVMGVVRRHGGNLSQAALSLSVSRRSLERWMMRWGEHEKVFKWRRAESAIAKRKRAGAAA